MCNMFLAISSAQPFFVVFCVKALCSSRKGSTCRCIWKDASNCWQAFLDVCPHRLIPLSEGRITDSKELQCAYHGWCFEASGKCTAIPQGGNANNPRTCATVYQCAVKQGELSELLWVSMIQLAAWCPASKGQVGGFLLTCRYIGAHSSIPLLCFTSSTLSMHICLVTHCIPQLLLLLLCRLNLGEAD